MSVLMADRHARNPKGIRMPAGMEERVETAAEATGESVNGFIVGAIEEKLQRHESGATTSARPSRNGATTAAAPVGAKQHQPRRTAKPPAAEKAAPAKFREPESASEMTAAIFRRRTGGER